MQTRYSWWQYTLITLLFVISLIYALPNLYIEDPVVQIAAKQNIYPNDFDAKLSQLLTTLNIKPVATEKNDFGYLVRFNNTSDQLNAKASLSGSLGKDYVVALNLISRTPKWLRNIWAKPMKLGLDLRGGVHLLLDVDITGVVGANLSGMLKEIATDLRASRVRYTKINLDNHTKISVIFKDQAELAQAVKILSSKYPNYKLNINSDNNTQSLTLKENETKQNNLLDYIMEQTISSLNNRVNELGISEAVIQRQGDNKISVDLPGIQDITRAKEILGKTATLSFHLLNIENDPNTALTSGIPAGNILVKHEDGTPYLLQEDAILEGKSITYASASIDRGTPIVSITLGGGGETYFNRKTAENIHKPLATVYRETKTHKIFKDGKEYFDREHTEKIINIATIQTALPSTFQITGLKSISVAEDLALLLRAGSMVAPVDIIEELTVGPSLGEENINKGIKSLLFGLSLVVVFMICYYRLFGLLANLGLLFNVLLIISILSVLGATLTLPAIAAIVLTIGMAVDANVLINERIREELRLGVSPMASINAGYEKAFATIVDANVTTLIVAFVLYGLGSGSVRGFAVTLIIGLLASMISSIYFTRALVYLVYRGRKIKQLSIGI